MRPRNDSRRNGREIGVGDLVRTAAAVPPLAAGAFAHVRKIVGIGGSPPARRLLIVTETERAWCDECDLRRIA